MKKIFCNISVKEKKYTKKTRSSLTNVGKHLLRLQLEKYSKADPNRKDDNEVLINMECETLSKSLTKFLKDNDVKTRNSETIQAYQLVFSIPKECFGNKELIEEWKKETIKFINESEIFKDNCLLLVYHGDETQPHIQGIFVPRIGNKLNFKEMLGGPLGPLKLSKLHDDYATYHQPLGFSRGDGTHTKGLSHKQYDKALEEMNKGLPEPLVLPAIPKPEKTLGIVTNSKKIISQLQKQNKILKSEYENLRKLSGKSYFYETQNNNLKKINEKLKIKVRNNLMKYDKQKQEELRQISCVEILQRLGYEVKNEGSTYRLQNEEFNIVINKDNKFFDNKSGKGSFGAISLLVEVFKYSFKDAISYLSNNYGVKQTTDTILVNKVHTTAIVENTVETLTEIPKAIPKNINKVVDYLVNKRKISKSLIDELITKNLLFADRNNNCVFMSEAHTFAFLRGSTEKKYVSCRGKLDFITYDFGNPKNVYLFESAIDALSFRTMNPTKDGSYVVLNGSALINRAQEITKQADKVFLCFDNDEQGSKFCDKLSGVLLSKSEILKPVSKDFNGDLQNGDYSTTKRSNDLSAGDPKIRPRID